MQTAAYTGSSTIEIRDIEPTEPAAGEVRIRVAYVGLCGTELAWVPQQPVQGVRGVDPQLGSVRRACR